MVDLLDPFNQQKSSASITSRHIFPQQEHVQDRTSNKSNVFRSRELLLGPSWQLAKKLGAVS